MTSAGAGVTTTLTSKMKNFVIIVIGFFVCEVLTMPHLSVISVSKYSWSFKLFSEINSYIFPKKSYITVMYFTEA